MSAQLDIPSNKSQEVTAFLKQRLQVRPRQACHHQDIFPNYAIGQHQSGDASPILLMLLYQQDN
jgi:hypothetical protein